MDPLERLLIIEEIKALKARYFRCMDTKDWSGFARVFTPDAVFDLSEIDSVRNPATGQWTPPYKPGSTVAGREAIVEMVRGGIEQAHTVHHGHMPEIDVLSNARARGIWAMEDVIRTEAGEPVLHGYGHYHESYEKHETGWAISHIKISRLYLAHTSRYQVQEKKTHASK